MNSESPTEEGKKRYPPDGMYDGEPCTCTPKCKEPCIDVNCPCSACCVASMDAYNAEAYEET